MAEKVLYRHLTAGRFENKLGLASGWIFLLDSYLQIFELWEIPGNRKE
jgi:hypothetical protein